jgi:hypothetical protein
MKNDLWAWPRATIMGISDLIGHKAVHYYHANFLLIIGLLLIITQDLVFNVLKCCALQCIQHFLIYISGMNLNMLVKETRSMVSKRNKEKKISSSGKTTLVTLKAINVAQSLKSLIVSLTDPNKQWIFKLFKNTF